MPLDIKEFVIQARFEEDQQQQDTAQKRMRATEQEALKEDIISECLERVEEFLRKRERR